MINVYNCIMFILFLFYLWIIGMGRGVLSLEIIILNPGIESMVCTTPSLVKNYIYVYTFGSTIIHWVGT